jgi:O-antigen ligase
MNLIKKFQDLAPYLLPFSLAFSRTIAEATLLLIVVLFLIKSFKEKDFLWLKIGWVRYFLIFIFYLIFLNSPFSINIKDSFIYSIEFIRWPLFSIALSYWIFTNTKSFEKLFISILIMMLIFLFFLWYQFIFYPNGIFGLSANNHGRLSVPFSNNVIPGRIITLFSFLSLPIYFFLSHIKKQKLSFFTMTLIIFIGLESTFITGERMSFLIFLNAFIIFCF